MNQAAHSLDARGLNCPLPILKTRKAITGMRSGEVLRITATDPGSVGDLDSFCTQTGHQMLSSEEADGTFVFHIRKA